MIRKAVYFGVFGMSLLWFCGLVAMALACFVSDALAHDDDPSHDEWYMSLKQPDNPGVPCCGVADAYWCDDISVKDGKTFCALTDDREIKGRPSLPMGMKIEIPDRKLKWEQDGKPVGNPIGHSVVFLSSGGAVYCFVQNTGI